MDRIIEKKKWSLKKILLLVAAGISALALLYILLFSGLGNSLYVEKNQITIHPVIKGKFQEFIPVDGVVFPKTTIFIDAVQGGFVDRLYVEDGALLKMGDPIIKLVNTSIELSYMDQETRIYDAINNLQNSKISLEQNKFIRQREMVELESQIDLLKKDYERKVKFHKERVISDKEFEDASREFALSMKKYTIALELKRLDSIASIEQKKQIDQSIARMSNNLNLLNRNLENMIIKSPVEGQLSGFSAEIGETKSAGQRLGQIDMLDGYKLRANIDERYVARVNLGQEAEMEFAGKSYTLEIAKIYTDVRNGVFQADLLFSGAPPEGMKKGQTFQLKLKFSSPTEALMLKRGGFFQQTGGNWVYVVDPSGKTAVKRTIRLGRQNTLFYEVLEGLEEGESVITSSYDLFGNKEKLILQ